MTDQNPTPGRFVRYILDQADVSLISSRRAADGIAGNPITSGMEFPALVVVADGNDDEGFFCNLQVFLDGEDPTFWAQEPEQGYQPGQWHWPTVA